ncbi:MULTISPECIES: enoyl-CoA hydratase/isomerase family protein [unclassified Nocardioides]|uniref:enoyl-CoA hydratase/isomerase family protein n=1 Tax=unclassified Nocardioides TaxID=2615069 RepID=UPI0006F24462|nr:MULTISPECIES: enoyl-CoA hydratase/isomerase family protein [unclassified Nocardioides]KQY54442.1 hypothetical protein ASD30_17435 [Nocardioides sp. Root140]KQZ66316.1 hypothetical protein ASD66_22515 [Nocardioides sp. Root151]KRF19517.1 hypothetical protein ASH02_23395 [Nocardioides sp. Soil796]
MTGRVQHVVIDAPERRNALSLSVLDSLTTAFTTLACDVTGVVLHGNGDVFSAGADFREITGTTDDVGYDEAVAAASRAIRAAPVAVVAALEGPCLGAAADLALSCDLRVAAEGSYLQVPAVRLGLLYNPESLGRLCDAYPRDAVRRLLLLGERFDHDSARAAGLVSQVVAKGTAVATAEALLGATTTEHLAAVAATKAVLNSHDAGTFDPVEWQSSRLALLGSPERASAVARARSKHLTKEGQHE